MHCNTRNIIFFVGPVQPTTETNVYVANLYALKVAVKTPVLLLSFKWFNSELQVFNFVKVSGALPSSYTVNNQKIKFITKYFSSTVCHFYITIRFLLSDNRTIVINWCVNIWCIQLSQCLLLTVLSILGEQHHFPPSGLSPEGLHFPLNPPYLACK